MTLTGPLGESWSSKTWIYTWIALGLSTGPVLLGLYLLEGAGSGWALQPQAPSGVDTHSGWLQWPTTTTKRAVLALLVLLAQARTPQWVSSTATAGLPQHRTRQGGQRAG